VEKGDLDIVGYAKWEEFLRSSISKCKRCPLHQSRTNIVPGEGNPRAQLMFVGEGPGADEDRMGRPFVGRAGKRLDLWISEYLNMKRQDVYIANTVKCRPPGNRIPTDEEMAMCFPFLLAQIEFIMPKVIVALGKTAAVAILGVSKATSLKLLRAENPRHQNGYYVVITYHPAAVLRNVSYEGAVREDLMLAKQLLEVG